MGMAQDTARPARSVVLAVATAQEKRACSAVAHMANGSGSPPMAFLQTGRGPLDPDHVVVQLRRLGASALISMGTAGGLAPALDVGTVLVPRRIRMRPAGSLETDADWQAALVDAIGAKLPVNTGDLLSVSDVVSHTSEKHALHAATSAVAVDMESAQLGLAARQAGIPFLVLRTVMDTSDDEIPAVALAAISADGDTAIVPLLFSLVRRPGDLPPLSKCSTLTAGGLHMRRRNSHPPCVSYVCYHCRTGFAPRACCQALQGSRDVQSAGQ
jgi:hypothetical protein